MSILTGLKRLFGIGGPKALPVSQSKQHGTIPHPTNAARRATSSTLHPKAFSLVEFSKLVHELQRKDALWPEIWTALNPDDDLDVQRLLVELRGPHMFTPHVALNALEEACHRRFQHDQNADRVAIIQAALKNCEPFSQ